MGWYSAKKKVRWTRPQTNPSPVSSTVPPGRSGPGPCKPPGGAVVAAHGDQRPVDRQAVGRVPAAALRPEGGLKQAVANAPVAKGLVLPVVLAHKPGAAVAVAQWTP